MAKVRLYIQESRTAVVEVEVADNLVAHPAENRYNTLQAMLHQPAEALLSQRVEEWGKRQFKIVKVQADYDGETYEERAR